MILELSIHGDVSTFARTICSGLLRGSFPLDQTHGENNEENRWFYSEIELVRVSSERERCTMTYFISPTSASTAESFSRLVPLEMSASTKEKRVMFSSRLLIICRRSFCRGKISRSREERGKNSQKCARWPRRGAR